MTLELVNNVCNLSGIAAHSIVRFTDGVNFVALVNGDKVVKVSEPELLHQWESDTRVLAHLQGKLDLPIPEFLGAGRLAGGFSYLLMSKVEGENLNVVWPTLSAENKREIVFEIGRVMKQVHRVAALELSNLPPQWDEFLRGQREKCLARHRRLKMPEWFLDGVEGWLQGVRLDGLDDRVILTGEYTPFNLLVSPSGQGYRLSGMIDFADSMIGPRVYDFLGPCLFLTAGDATLTRALFDGYGIDRPSTDQLLALQILHRYSDFDSQICVERWREKAHDFRWLRDLIWP